MCSLSDGLSNVIAGHLIEKWREPKREKGRRVIGTENKERKGDKGMEG